MPDKPEQLTRRGFVTKAAAAGAVGAAAPYYIPAGALGKPNQPGPNDRIHVGLIGAGGMGRANLKNCAKHSDVAVTGVCDVWRERRDRTVAEYSNSAKPYHDYREMLEQKDIDAVIIATPPHWHCLQAIDACQADKDLYVQKPMTLHLDESLVLKRAVQQSGRISQVGTQMHASENYRRVVELLRCGSLGKINAVRTFNVMNQGTRGIGTAPEGEPPEGLDWQQWVGPAPMHPFNPLIVKSAYENCSFMDYSGGWTPGMAPHIIDLPYWALEPGYPTVTFCSGGRFAVCDSGDAPDTQEVLWQYPEMTMSWSMSLVNSFGFDFGRGSRARRLGMYFHGVNGTVYTDYGEHEIVPEGDAMQDATAPEKSIPPSPGHEREWLDCIKTRQQPSCNVDYHCKIDVAIALANLSYKLGRAIRFDPERQRIVGDQEAVKLARPAYRDPWKFPDALLSSG